MKKENHCTAALTGFLFALPFSSYLLPIIYFFHCRISLSFSNYFLNRWIRFHVNKPIWIFRNYLICCTKQIIERPTYRGGEIWITVTAYCSVLSRCLRSRLLHSTAFTWLFLVDFIHVSHLPQLQAPLGDLYKFNTWTDHFPSYLCCSTYTKVLHIQSKQQSC